MFALLNVLYLICVYALKWQQTDSGGGWFVAHHYDVAVILCETSRVESRLHLQK